MNKDNLKYGNVVELRNGYRYLVIKNLYPCPNPMILKSLKDGVYEIKINDFNNELEYGNYQSIFICFDEFDIMKVYKDYTLKELLWDRKGLIKLTDDEKAILRNIDKEYKWLARDKDTDLYVFTGKPIKKDCWICGDEDYCDRMFIFKHLFQFIKCEDNEPYLIEDLLK